MLVRALQALALVFLACATALAGPERPAQNRARAQFRAPRVEHPSCYVLLSGSMAPQPCDRLGPQPSTAIPMDIIGIPPRPKRAR